jgi:hypothetical protein
LEGCLHSGIFAVGTVPKVFARTREAEDALGKLPLLVKTQTRSHRPRIADTPIQVDSGIEVHKQFGFYLPGSKITSQMSWTQRGVGILQALREYAPVTNILALILLPVAIFPTPSDDFATIASGHDLFWLRTIFLAAFLARKTNNYIVYGHVGLRRLASFQSMDIWCAPCKPTPIHTTTTGKALLATPQKRSIPTVSRIEQLMMNAKLTNLPDTATRCILSLLPTTFTTPTFESSGSISSPANERSRLHRAPLPNRLLTPTLLMHLAYLVSASIPLALRFLALASAASFPFPGALLKLLDALSKAAVPLLYMLDPPTVPEREELMELDEVAGVRRPKKRKEKDSGRVDAGSADVVGWPWMEVVELALVCCWCGRWWGV